MPILVDLRKGMGGSATRTHQGRLIRLCGMFLMKCSLFGMKLQVEKGILL